MQKDRLKHMDIAKGIGIIAIILGHASSVFEKYVFPFHVPLFFLVSGYFLSCKKQLPAYMKNKARQLLVPYCATSLLIVVERMTLAIMRGGDWQSELFHALLSAVYGSGSSANKTPFEIKPIGAIWFLPALFTALLLVRIITQYRYHRAIIVSLVAISLITSRLLQLPGSVQEGITAGAYVYVGMIAKDKACFDNKWIAATGLAIYIIEVITCTNVSVASNHYGAYGLAGVSAVLISYSVVYLAGLMSKYGVANRPFEFLGKNTLPILCFHTVEITAFPWGHLSLMAELVLLLAFPVICVLLLHNSRVYRFVFG